MRVWFADEPDQPVVGALRVGRLDVELEAESGLACAGDDERRCGRVLDRDSDGLVERHLLRRRTAGRRAVDEFTNSTRSAGSKRPSSIGTRKS